MALCGVRIRRRPHLGTNLASSILKRVHSRIIRFRTLGAARVESMRAQMEWSGLPQAVVTLGDLIQKRKSSRIGSSRGQKLRERARQREVLRCLITYGWISSIRSGLEKTSWS